MKNFNKENLWNSIAKKCPISHQLFKEFMSKYEKEIDWDVFFRNYGFTHTTFYSIPLEMQIGILMRFFSENGIQFLNETKFTFRALSKEVKACFKEMEDNIRFRKQWEKLNKTK